MGFTDTLRHYENSVREEERQHALSTDAPVRLITKNTINPLNLNLNGSTTTYMWSRRNWCAWTDRELREAENHRHVLTTS